jgi:dolichyl-phosphate-mannose-protein mannosyltransferase
MLGSRTKAAFPLYDPLPPLCALILASFGLRAYQLGAQSLWYDEAVSVYIARQEVPALIAHTAGDIHPPLYYLLLHFWLQIAGVSEFAAAYFSLFFGVLLVALAFRLARDWFGLNTGFITALLVAFSSFNLWYSQEVRMYTLSAALVICALILTGRLWTAHFDLSQRRNWLTAPALALCLAGGLYTHYYFAFFWVFLAVYVSLALWLGSLVRLIGRLSGKPIRRQAKVLSSVQSVDKALPPNSPSVLRKGLGLLIAPFAVWVYVQILAVALFIPWFPTAFRQATDPPVPPWRSFVAWPEALSGTLTALAFGQSISLDLAWPGLAAALLIIGLALCVVLTGVFRGEARKVKWALLALGVTAAPFTAIAAATYYLPLYHVRYMFIFAIGFTILLASGLVWLGHRSLLLVLVLLGILVGTSMYAEIHRRGDPAYAKDDFRTAVRFIAERARPGDAILINAGYMYPAFDYYYPGTIDWQGRLPNYSGDDGPTGVVVAETGSLDAGPNLGWGSPDSDFYATDEAATTKALDNLLAKHPRLWVLRANDTVNDPKGIIRNYLVTHGLEFAESNVIGESFVKVQGFVARSAAIPEPVSSATPSIQIGQQFSLLAWNVPPTVSITGDLDLTLFWSARAPIDVDYHASVGLYDARGVRWASRDGIPVGEMLKTGDWPVGQVLPDAWKLHIPIGVPPGDYTLQVSLYDPVKTSPLPVPNGAEGTRARLGLVQVMRPLVPTPEQSIGVLSRLGDPLFDGRFALVSDNIAQEKVKPGEAVRADLMWNAVETPGEDVNVVLTLLDDRGRSWATRESGPVDGRFPTSRWVSGDFVLDSSELVVPPDAPDGKYHLVLSMNRTRNRERLSVTPGWWPLASDSIDLATVEVKGREHLTRAPANVGTPTRVRFGDSALLIGYDVQLSQPVVKESRPLTLTLYWHALAPMSTSYKAFVHVVGANQQIMTQRDSVPGDGEYPTTGWLEGEYLVDVYRLDLQADMPPGDYIIYVGLYDPDTTVRLSIFGEDGKMLGDRWPLGQLTLP